MSGNEENQWYTNKELFEMLVNMKDDFSGFRGELQETRNLIKSYNGLREEIEKMRRENQKLREESDEIKTQVQVIISKDTGKRTTMESLRNWGGWLFGMITLLVLLYNQIV